MPRSIEAISAELNALDESAFDPWRTDSRGAEILNQLMDEVRTLPNAREAVPMLFSFLERLHESDLGSPGPVVHALEEVGGYEAELAESVLRQPTPLTVWMVNRLLNVERDSARRERLISLLRVASTHVRSSSEAVEFSLSFIRHQCGAT